MSGGAGGVGGADRRGRRKERVGTVVSDRMRESVVVLLERKVAHPVYGKQTARSKRVTAHNAGDRARQGDVVRIVETRPLSKTKCWRVVEVVHRAG